MKSIVNTLKVVVSPNQQRLLVGIEREDFTPVVRLAEKEIRARGEVPPSVDGAIYALKQYYALAALNPANMHAVSDVVDPYWHAHILHTNLYNNFCTNNLKYFMHHEPLDHSVAEEVRAIGTLYSYTLEVLGLLFGDDVDKHYWPTNPGDARMVCRHYNVKAPLESILPLDPRLAHIQEVFA